MSLFGPELLRELRGAKSWLELNIPIIFVADVFTFLQMTVKPQAVVEADAPSTDHLSRPT